MKKITYITIMLLMLPVCKVSAQIVDTLDIMKEFDEYSFREAQNTAALKDSTKLREHLIGIKVGLGINNVFYSQDIETKSLLSYKNFGLYYTYYHSLWNQYSLFGIEMGVQYNEEGYISVRHTTADPKDKGIEGKERFQEITIPFVSQLRIDFWRMRLLANVGAFGSYKIATSFSGNVADSITTTYKKGGYGFIVGGGLAFVFRPFEIHLEANYKYNLSNLYDQKAYYENVWVSSHTNQIIVSAGLFYRIGGSGYKNPANNPRKRRYKEVEIDVGK